MRLQSIRPAIALAAAALALCAGANPARAQDTTDLMLRHAIPPDMTNRHGYSDFTDPLGRFLDLLAAGAFAEAKVIQPDACATWSATRKSSAFTGKFTLWNTDFDLDTLCRH